MTAGPPKIGQYQLLGALTGGTNPFYKAQSADGRVVALKALPLKGSTPEQLERFQREAEIAKSLEHPNLLAVIEAGTTETHSYQVMPFLEGSDLRKHLARQHPFTMEQKLSIMEQTCDALAYAHQRGLVHRDLKPSNIFIETSGVVRILDFGVARVANSNLTQAGVSLGTLNYMSPEQIRGEKCTAASDIFSCGVVFYELLAGRHPFSFNVRELSEIVSNMMFEAPTPLAELMPNATQGLDMMINQTLEKDPARRVQNASELRGLLRFCRSSGGSVAIPQAAPQAPKRTDMDKTRVISRSVPAIHDVPVKAAPPPPPPPPPAATPKPAQPKAAAAPSPAAAVFYCPACTHPNVVGAKVCARCSTPLAIAARQVTGLHAADKGNRQVIIGAIILGVLLIAALLYRFFLK